DYQGFAIGHPQQLVRAEAMAGVFAGTHKAPLLDAVDADHTTAWIAGVVFRGVEPVATLVKYAVAKEMPILGRFDDLQQAAVAAVPPADENGKRQVLVSISVVTALGHGRRECLAAIELLTDRIVLSIGVVAGG